MLVVNDKHFSGGTSMAFIHDHYAGEVTLRDSGNDGTRMTFELRGATYADASTNMTALVASLAAVTDAAIDGYRVYEVFIQDTPEVIADATVRNSVQALVTVTLSSSPLDHATLAIPAPNIGIFTAATGENSDICDPNDAALVAYVEEFQLGGSAFISDGQNVAVAPDIKGVRRTLKRRLA
jgi:hypothetical protein